MKTRGAYTGSLAGLGAGILLAVFLKPALLEQIGPVNRVFQISATIVFLVLLARTLLKRGKVSSTFLLLTGYRLVLLIPTVANDGDLAAWGSATVSQLGLFLLIEAFTGAGLRATRLLLSAASTLLLLYLFANLVTIFTEYQSQASWTNGYTQTTYFLGIRTRATDTVIPAIMITLLSDFYKGRRCSLKTLLVVAIGVAQLLYLNVATGIVGLAIMSVLYLSYRYLPWTRALFSMRMATVGGIVMSLLFVFARVQESPLVASLTAAFGKSVTLTGRTEIWATALPIVFERPFLGNGVDHNFGAFVPWTADRLWQAHSLYLQLFYDSGVIGVFIFVLFLFSAAKRLDRRANPLLVRASISAAFGAFMVMSISEIFTYNMGVFFLVPFLASALAGGAPRSNYEAHASDRKARSGAEIVVPVGST